MKSTVGRPRTLSQEQIEIVLAWHARNEALKAARKALKTRRQLAQELGVAPSTINYVIRHRGKLKQVPPEERLRALAERRRRVARLRRRGFI